MTAFKMWYLFMIKELHCLWRMQHGTLTAEIRWSNLRRLLNSCNLTHKTCTHLLSSVFWKHSTDVDSQIRTHTHPYECSMHTLALPLWAPPIVWAVHVMIWCLFTLQVSVGPCILPWKAVWETGAFTCQGIFILQESHHIESNCSWPGLQDACITLEITLYPRETES